MRLELVEYMLNGRREQNVGFGVCAPPFAGTITAKHRHQPPCCSLVILHAVGRDSTGEVLLSKMAQTQMDCFLQRFARVSEDVFCLSHYFVATEGGVFSLDKLFSQFIQQVILCFDFHIKSSLQMVRGI